MYVAWSMVKKMKIDLFLVAMFWGSVNSASENLLSGTQLIKMIKHGVILNSAGHISTSTSVRQLMRFMRILLDSRAEFYRFILPYSLFLKKIYKNGEFINLIRNSVFLKKYFKFLNLRYNKIYFVAGHLLCIHVWSLNVTSNFLKKGPDDRSSINPTIYQQSYHLILIYFTSIQKFH